jgi:UDP-galactopyranose mutase (EC 5.4.99.9)
MKKEYHYLLVGAGLFNAVFAFLAKQHGKRCLIIEKRSHIGGNVYCKDIEGIHVHRYGPHIFHTNNQEVWSFVNRFVTFNHFILCPIANYRGRLYNLPFNMNTFYQMWGAATPKEAQSIIRLQTAKITKKPDNLEEQAISLVGRDIYETLIKGYTEKQWGRACNELPAFIIRRLPVRYTFDNNYFSDRYQGIPEGGYNPLINALLHGTEYKINYNYFDDKSHFDELAEKIIFTGPIDEFFGYQLGCLEYRSLSFEDEIIPIYNYQGNAMVNYTDVSEPYTRIIEHKHFDVDNVEVQRKPITIITKEFPKSSTGKNPYYPVNDRRNQSLYMEYKSIAQKHPNVLFAGRLGQYKYMNMDEVIYNSIKLAEKELNN